MSRSFDDEKEMFVTKRGGQREIVSFDKILQRIKRIGQEVDIKLNYTSLAMKVIDQLYDGISTTQIDELTSEQCASLASTHPDYNTLAGRIVVSNHQKNTSSSFVEVMTRLYEYKDKHCKQSPLVSDELINAVVEHGEFFDGLCDYSRDYLIDYFGFKTLERAYLMQIDRQIVERPQHMWLRVAIGIHGANSLDRVKETYDLMSQKYFTHATPTLFNAGTPHQQLSSCFLLAMESDSIEGIYNTLKDCALISKWAGGIGLHIHNIRASGSHIRGTNGSSNGLVPMLRVFNNTAKYVDQCVVPETIIYTTDGPKQIQDCVSGVTQVFNKTGGVETIQRVLEHSHDGELIEIYSGKFRTPLRITGEHPVLLLKNGSTPTTTYYTNADLIHFIGLENPPFVWTDAKEVREGDWIVHSIPKYEKDDSSISEETAYMYGVLISSIQEYDPQFYTFKLYEDKRETVKKYLSENCLEYEQEEDGGHFIRVQKSVHFPFQHSDFYGEQNKIRIHPRWLFLSLAKTKALRIGLTNVLRMNETRNRFEEEIQFTQKRVLNGSVANYFYMDGVGYIFCNKDVILYTVTEIKKCQYSGTLYDLQMETEHNYLLANGLVHNGGGKRNGSFAIYLEPWHADIEVFLQMRKNHGEEELKARDLFYALWIPDLFMERVKSDGQWTLMCPDECPGLADVYGDAFVQLYESYETAGRGRKTVKARELWFQMMDAQMETGTPYLLYKDACNKKSNQKNLGTIKSSNLCSEVVQYSDAEETAVCNLASIGLPTFVDPATGQFDFEKLHAVASVVTYNLNRVIDVNYYPTEKTRKSNVRHRPIGIGIQGLADVFMMMNMPFASPEAKQMNRDIFETIYHAAVSESCRLAEEEGPYETFQGSPASKGELQFDLWSVDPTQARYDWLSLKERVKLHGLRNSLLLAPMPTASTSQILGFNECIEPITSNIYSRRTLAGEFVLANKYLMRDLIRLDLWNDKIKNNIIANHGSIQQIKEIPDDIKEIYKTVWEIPMRDLIDMAADRGAFICQSQSLNLWLEDPIYSSLTSMHFYSWSKGLKTGIYYLRRRGKHRAQQFTIEPERGGAGGKEMVEEEHEICDMCSA
jgi:ribonucleoside-diphosphate reductase alpha subunit